MRDYLERPEEDDESGDGHTDIPKRGDVDVNEIESEIPICQVAERDTAEGNALEHDGADRNEECGSVQNVDTDGREGERGQEDDDLPDTEGPEREEESDAERSELRS